jgi:hypothetical protein
MALDFRENLRGGRTGTLVLGSNRFPESLGMEEFVHKIVQPLANV